MEFFELLSLHAGTAYGRQLALGDLLGEHDWRVDIRAGTVTFEREGSFPIQLLGTESHTSNTWLWAWANERSNLPEEVLRVARSIREYGEENNVRELTQSTFELTVADGHRLSMVCSGLRDRVCYYRGPYEGGALFFLVEDLPPSLVEPAPPERLTRILTEVISSFDVDHHLMASGLLRAQGATFHDHRKKLEATLSCGATLCVHFDAAGRIAKVEASTVSQGGSS